MPPEEEIVQYATDQTFWAVLVLMLSGTVGRYFISPSPFDPRRFIGEMLLAFVGTVMLYAAGLLQGFSPLQIIFIGSLAGLGGVRLMEWIFKIWRKVREVV